METPVQPAPKKNTGMIIAIVVVVLLCCCCLIAVGAYFALSSSVNNVFNSINEGLENPVLPDVPSDNPPDYAAPESTPDTSFPSVPDITSDYIPQGGLGDEILRTDTWVYVVSAAAMTGCSAMDPSSTVIDVTAQPDSAGVWEEQWTVTCDDGSTKAFDVTFTPSSGGGTDISVKTAK